jgi:hypothetical protein
MQLKPKKYEHKNTQVNIRWIGCVRRITNAVLR